MGNMAVLWHCGDNGIDWGRLKTWERLGVLVLRHGRDVHLAWVNVVTAALATKVVQGSGDES
jgi:hypothetical protein